MNNTKNITIALLLISAIVLGAVLIQGLQENKAYAASGVKQSSVIMCTGSIRNSIDLLYVINLDAKQLVAYYANTNTNDIDIVQKVDLEKAFGS